jgi:hypothetical protein
LVFAIDIQTHVGFYDISGEPAVNLPVCEKPKPANCLQRCGCNNITDFLMFPKSGFMSGFAANIV